MPFGSILDLNTGKGYIIFSLIIQQIVTLSKYGHDSLNICHP